MIQVPYVNKYSLDVIVQIRKNHINVCDKFSDVEFDSYVSFGKFLKDFDYLNINPKMLSIEDIVQYSSKHSH
jgi:hypothetical protein